MGNIWNKGYAGREEKAQVFGGEELQSGEYTTSFSDNNVFSWNDLSLIADVATQHSQFYVSLIVDVTHNNCSFMYVPPQNVFVLFILL